MRGLLCLLSIENDYHWRCLVNRQVELVKISSVVYLLPYTLRDMLVFPANSRKRRSPGSPPISISTSRQGVARMQRYENDGSITSDIAYIALAPAGWT